MDEIRYFLADLNWSKLFTLHFWWYSGLGGSILGVLPLALAAWILPFEFSSIPDIVTSIFIIAGVTTVATGVLMMD